MCLQLLVSRLDEVQLVSDLRQTEDGRVRSSFCNIKNTSRAFKAREHTPTWWNASPRRLGRAVRLDVPLQPEEWGLQLMSCSWTAGMDDSLRPWWNARLESPHGTNRHKQSVHRGLVVSPLRTSALTGTFGYVRLRSALWQADGFMTGLGANEGKRWPEMVVFMLPVRPERGKSRKLALVPSWMKVQRGGETDGRRGVRRRERNRSPLPWGRRSTIPPTVVTEGFIYLRRPSVQPFSNSPRERSFGLSAPPF